MAEAEGPFGGLFLKGDEKVNTLKRVGGESGGGGERKKSIVSLGKIRHTFCAKRVKR